MQPWARFLFVAVGWIGLLPLQVASGGDEPTKMSSITGVLRWADGRPLVEPHVALHPWDQKLNRWRPAERTAEVDTQGKFAFDGVTEDYYCVAARVSEAGAAFRTVITSTGQPATTSITLRPAVASFLTVRDDQGRPLAGARCRGWEIVDGSEGTFGLRRGSEESLRLPVEVSDETGRLRLAALPEGAILKSITLEHPEFAAASLEPQKPLQAGEVAACQLQPGFPVQLRFVSPETGTNPADLTEVFPRINHQNLRDPNSIYGISFPVKDGALALPMQPGPYQMIWLTSERYLFTPFVYLQDGKHFTLAPGQNDRWTLRALPKVAVRGRVLKADGQPIAKAYIKSEIENMSGDESAPADLIPWCHAEWAQTDDNGEYKIHVAPGRSRIQYSGDGLPSLDPIELTIAGRDEQRASDIVVRDLPPIRGTVIGLDGQPSPKTLVRAFSDSSLRYIAKPVLTDDAGRFEIPLTSMPVNFNTEARVYKHQVFAYHPHESLGGVATIDLHDEQTTGDVRIEMKEQSAEWPLSEMRVAFNEWERGEPSETVREERIKPENAIGSAVPELDGILWLNSKTRRLTDFRGQYVFLDFYTTWCGPCNGDYPTVKLIHDLYKDHGVTVIGVHDNSSAHDVIRDHAAAKKMEMPIVVDREDGRILKAYEKLWLAMGYPSYVLLDREGRLLQSDRCTPGPTLRAYKLEIVRQVLLQSR